MNCHSLSHLVHMSRSTLRPFIARQDASILKLRSVRLLTAVVLTTHKVLLRTVLGLAFRE